ncbi:FkbM family methyltransferase [Bernardetia sp. OM2101]|uniref:FkbM family methyltransferase n=1 Tax=Bernardetia sp. OM2101 TaxID=3344876 RepID=UPI0035CF03A1
MTRWEKIKIITSRGWSLSGKYRLARYMSKQNKTKPVSFTGISWMQNENILLHIDTSSYVEWCVFSMAEYETELARLIQSQVKVGNVCLDIGANVGIQSLRMAQETKQTGKVIAFEPVSYLRERLEKNIALNKASQIEVLPYALSDFSGTSTMNINPEDSNQGTASLSDNGNTEIQVRKGDDLLKEMKIERLDFIKIDVEGFEYQVLIGLKESIKRFRPSIVFEYDDNYCVKRGKKSYIDFYIFFEELDYSLFGVNEIGGERLHKDSQKIESNILALPRN